ncbi:MAG: TolC family protein [Verrucomicrobia bacterium]|nr:TolC family protein [Verrucomicrobiota bacterium]
MRARATSARSVLFVLLAAAALPATAADSVLTLERVVGEVRAHNPQLRAATAMAAADRERIAQAAAWEDPVAGLEFQRDSSNRLTTYDHAELSLTQKIPLSGNRERRRALAAAGADISTAAIRSREFMLIAEARDAFFQLLRAREQLALTKETAQLLTQAVDITRSRLTTGNGNVAAVLMAETERVRLDERVIMLDREIADASAALNTLRDLPPQAPVGELAAPALPAAAGTDLPFATLADAQAHALAHRPEFAETTARITEAQRARELADRAWRPDPEVMVKARHMNTDSRVIKSYDTGIAVSLPWFNDGKYRSAQREADKRREAAELDAAALRTKTVAEVRDMWQRIETARRNLELFRDKLLPLARQGAEATQQGLINGSVSIAELVVAQRSLVDAQISLAANLADFHRYRAMLATLAGTTDHP